MIRALIFDFNGVLVDDEIVHFNLFREILGEEGTTITLQDYQQRYLGYDDRGCFAAVLQDHGQFADEAKLDELIQRKARRYVTVADQGLSYFPHAGEVLTRLSLHWPIAICSGALRSEIEYALHRLNSSNCIVGIIAAEDAHKCKPDPAGYLKALDLLRSHEKSTSPTSPPLGADQCIVFEDSLAGILSAKAAGMWAVGITHTYTAEQLRRTGADHVIDRLEILTPEWILDWEP